jgi:hypothetical protein
MVGVRFLVGASDFSLFPKVQTNIGAHLASYPMGTGAIFREYSGRNLRLIIYFYLVPRSRMVEPYLHSPYVFMACA